MPDDSVLAAPATIDAPQPGAATAGAEAPADAVKADREANAADTPKDETAGEKKLEDEGKAEAEKNAPEDYADFALPDGVELDADALDQFKPVAKELGLTQEQAQKLVDVFAARQQAAAEAQRQAWTDMQSQWVDQAKADKEFGGAKFDENVAAGRKALDRFGTPELKEALNLTGAGNHPEFIRFCVRVGKAVANDGLATGHSGASPKTVEEKFYPSMMTGKE